MEAPAVSPPIRTAAGSWTTQAEHFDYKLEEVLAADILLIGRVTYESFGGSWPEGRGEFAH